MQCRGSFLLYMTLVYAEPDYLDNIACAMPVNVYFIATKFLLDPKKILDIYLFMYFLFNFIINGDLLEAL
jgi:hypothetical protein